MRFFTKELWYRINDENEIVRRNAEKEWDRMQAEYQIQFEEIKMRLSRRFIAAMQKHDYLHDYTILEIALTRCNRGRYACKLVLTNTMENVQITMKGISKAEVGICTFQNCIQGDLSWGYCEFSKVSSDVLSLSILCDFDNEMVFEFKSITMERYCSTPPISKAT